MTTRLPLSAVLITLNAAAQLKPTLDSLDFCDDLLVLDSGSHDGTQALAHAAGARVLHQDWLGFGAQKQKAVELARHDWVLCLDADEVVTPELRKSILAELSHPSGPSHPAFQFARCNRFLGRYLKHGEGYPDLSLRLFDRRQARWSEDTVHEKVICDGPVGRLAGDLLHHSAESLSSYLTKQNRYTTLAAEQAFLKGKRCHSVQIIASPLLRFIKFYLLRQGFRDGLPGLIHTLIGCQNSFVKYAKIRELEVQRPPEGSGTPPAQAQNS